MSGGRYDALRSTQGVHSQAGEPYPGYTGWVIGKCGHRICEQDWTDGFRWCMRCPAVTEWDQWNMCPVCRAATGAACYDRSGRVVAGGDPATRLPYPHGTRRRKVSRRGQ